MIYKSDDLRNEELPLVFKSVEALNEMTHARELQRVIVDDGVNNLQEYLYINGEWRILGEQSEPPQLIDPLLLIVKKEDLLPESAADKQRAVVYDGVSKPKEYIYLEQQWHNIQDIDEKDDPNVIIVGSVAARDALDNIEVNQRVIVHDGVSEYAEEYIFDGTKWIANFEEEDDIIIVDSLTARDALQQVKHKQQVLVYDGTTPPTLYIYVTDKWVQVYDAQKAILSSIVVVESEEARDALQGLPLNQRVLVREEGATYGEEFILQENGWVSFQRPLQPLLVVETEEELPAGDTKQRAIVYDGVKAAKEFVWLGNEWVQLISGATAARVVASVEERDALQDIEEGDRVLIHDGVTEEAEEYVCREGLWIRLGAQPSSGTLIVETIDELYALVNVEDKQHVIVFNGVDMPVEYVWLDQWVQLTPTYEHATFSVVENTVELVNLEGVSEGDHAFVETSSTEYVYAAGQWRPVFTLDTLNVSATQVTTTTSLQFISAGLKQQITTNQLDINTLTNKVTELQELLEETKKNDKVSLHAADAPGYLSEKMGTTLTVENNVVEVASILGQLISIEELNSLEGARSNIQLQIDALSRVGNFTGSVENHAALLALNSPGLNDMVIVLSDETKEGVSTIYMHDATNWVFVGEFKIEMRDFSIQKIDLATETTGTLPKARYELPVAKDVKITDAANLYPVDNVESALEFVAVETDELKQKQEALEEQMESIGLSQKEVMSVAARYLLPSVGNEDVLYVVWKDETNSNKTSLYTWNKEETMYTLLIASSVSGQVQEYQQLTMTGVVASTASPRVFPITIPQTNNFLRGPVSVLKFSRGANNILLSQMTFSASDQQAFEENAHVLFDGVMKLITEHKRDMVRDDSWTGEGYVSRYLIKRDEWGRIDKIDVSVK